MSTDMLARGLEPSQPDSVILLGFTDMVLGLHLPHELNLLEPYRTQTVILGHERTSNVWIKIRQLVHVAIF